MFNPLFPELGLSTPLFAILLIWTVVWKGLALWKSARLQSKVWFIVLLVVNTLGILEILYLFVFSKMSSKQTKKGKKKRKKK